MPDTLANRATPLPQNRNASTAEIAMTQERNERDARIIKRAAEIWSEEGGLMNRHEAQWLMAMRQIDEEDRGGPVSTYATAPAGSHDAGKRMHSEMLEQSFSMESDDQNRASASVPARPGTATRIARWFFARH